jgi:hypothetical protein
VFGIAVSGALRELIGDLVHLPGERADGDGERATNDLTEEAGASAHANDELARRRERRSATA